VIGGAALARALESHARRARGRSFAWPIAGVLAGAIAGARALEGGAVGWAIACAALGGAALALGAPFRVLWAEDLAPLMALPIDGRALYGVALRRTARAFLGAALAVALAVLIGALFGAGWPLRLLLLSVLLAAFGAAAGLAGAVAGGAIGASPELRRRLSGGLDTPNLTWVTLPSALAGGVVVLLALVLAPWVSGQPPRIGTPAAWLGAGAAAVPLALAFAARLGGAALARTLRSLSAADRERLAHVELDGPSGVERLAGRPLAAPARLVLAKDASLVRRRHPAAHYGLGLLAAVLVGSAIMRPDDYVWWTLGPLAVGCVYAVVLSARLGKAPIEASALIGSLPLSSRDVHAAKRAWAFARLLWPLVPAAALACIRAPEPLPLAGLAAGLVVVAAVLVSIRAGYSADQTGPSR
jgi:hypothetical protein